MPYVTEIKASLIPVPKVSSRCRVPPGEVTYIYLTPSVRPFDVRFCVVLPANVIDDVPVRAFWFADIVNVVP